MTRDQVDDNYVRLLAAARIAAGNPSSRTITAGMGNTVSHSTIARVFKPGEGTRRSVDLIAAYLTQAGSPEHDAILAAWDRDHRPGLPAGPLPPGRRDTAPEVIAAAIRDALADQAEAIRYLADTLRDVLGPEKWPDHH